MCNIYRGSPGSSKEGKVSFGVLSFRNDGFETTIPFFGKGRTLLLPEERGAKRGISDEGLPRGRKAASRTKGCLEDERLSRGRKAASKTNAFL